MKKRALSIVAMLLALILAAACAGTSGTNTDQQGGETNPGTATQAPQVVDGDTPDVDVSTVKDSLTIAIWSNPQTFDPTDVTLQPDQHVINAIFDTLVWPANEEGVYEGRLAKSYEFENDTTLVFHLRDDVYFHNGEKLTADDVVFSLLRDVASNGNKSSFSGFDPENIVARDEYTVQIGFTYPNVAALAYLASPRGGIVCKSAFEAMGPDEFKTNPVGSGMFKFVSFESGDRVVLERNEEYWGQKPLYKNLYFRVITEDSVRAMEVQSGGVDIAMKIAASDFDNLKLDPGLIAIAGKGVTQSSFQFNAQQERFADIRIRQAMNYALDMPAIVRAVYGEYAEPASSLFAPSVMYYKQEGPIVQNQELARQLVAEAGYGEEGFSCEITLPQESDMLAIAEICKAQWEECNIHVTITIMEQVALREANTKGLNEFVRASFFCSTADPSQCMMVWGSNWNGGLRVRDEHVDELLQKGLAAMDPEERAAVYAELQDYCWEMFQCINLAVPMNLCVTTGKLKNFVLPTGYITYYNSFYVEQ